MTKSRIRIVLEMIKFEHSVFALPFALVGALLAARAGGGLPTWRQILWIVVAMVGARSAAMTMNRIADLEYDRRNPRTANRALPAGELSVGFAWVFTVARFGGAGFRGVAIESAGAEAFARGAGDSVFLFLHEAIHVVVALRAGLLPGHFARGRVDCDSRLARRAHADSLRRGHAVGRRLRRALRLPGCRIRQAAGLHSIPKKFGIARALRIARVMHVVMVALLVWLALEFPSRLAGLGGNRRGRGAAGLRAFAREAERPEQNECCVFHREWLY